MLLFFDILITIGITITAIPAVILLYSRKKRKKSWEYKHKKITLLISCILLFCTLTLIYGSFIEPKILTTQYYEIDFEKINNPIKIAFIADYQVGKIRKEKWVQKSVNQIIKLNPDLIFIGGDLVNNENYDLNELDELKPLEKLAKKIPIYSIHGNHEYGIGKGKSINNPKYRIANISKETEEYVENLGIRYLINEMEIIEINEEKFYLFGADSVWANKIDYSTLQKRQEDIPTIALIHNPAETFKAPRYDIDLMLSGHTHGGQIRLPFIGPIGRIDDYTPTEWYQGLHDYMGMKLLVTSGIGESGTRARLFNPPEIVMLTIK